MSLNSSEPESYHWCTKDGLKYWNNWLRSKNWPSRGGVSYRIPGDSSWKNDNRKTGALFQGAGNIFYYDTSGNTLTTTASQKDVCLNFQADCLFIKGSCCSESAPSCPQGYIDKGVRRFHDCSCPEDCFDTSAHNRKGCKNNACRTWYVFTSTGCWHPDYYSWQWRGVRLCVPKNKFLWLCPG